MIRLRNLGDPSVSSSQSTTQALLTTPMEPAQSEETPTISHVTSSSGLHKLPREGRHWEKPDDEMVMPTLSDGFQRVTRSKSGISSVSTRKRNRTCGSSLSAVKNVNSISKQEKSVPNSSCPNNEPEIADESNQPQNNIDRRHALGKRRRIDTPTRDERLQAAPSISQFATSTTLNNRVQNPLSSRLCTLRELAAAAVPFNPNVEKQQDRERERREIENAADILMSLRDEDSTLRMALMEEEALKRQISQAQKELSDIITGKITRGAIAGILDKKKGGNELYRRTLGFYLECLQWWQSRHPDVQGLQLPSTKDLKASDAAVQIGDIYEVLRRAAVWDMRERVLELGRSEMREGESRGELSALWWRMFEKWSLPEDEVAQCRLSQIKVKY
jgi:hypothetical protein